MMRSTLEVLSAIRSGMSVGDFVAAFDAGTTLPAVQYDTAVPDDPIPFREFTDLGIAIVFDRNEEKVESVEYGPGFAAQVNGIAIGMTGDDVERILGPCDRTWSMPHPNYILIYDTPEFFRVDLSRDNERVITMYR